MSIRLITTFLALLLAAAGCAPSTAPGLPPRHVLLVTVEGLRADHLSAYQYGRPTSAWTVDGGQRELGRALAFDDLAAGGVLFNNAFSPAQSTLTALKSILVGAPPEFGEVVTGIDADVVTLAERFEAAGYMTAAFVSGERLGAAGGFEQGFAKFRHRARDEESLPMAVRWLFEHDLGTGQPLFLWIHLSGTATPYAPGITAPLPGPQADKLDYVRLHFEQARAQDIAQGREPELDHELEGHFEAAPFEVIARDFGTLFCDRAYPGGATGERVFLEAAGELAPADRRRVIDLYDGDVAELASRLRSFLLAYQSVGEINALFDDTLVVICAANGVELGEHGLWGESLYSGNLRVPLLFHHPNSIVGRRISDEVCDLSVVGPTLCDWSGALDFDLRPGRGGRSLAPILDLTSRSSLRGRPAVSVAAGGQQAASLRGERWTLVWRRQADGSEELRLFDRTADPLEQRDVSHLAPEVASELRNQLVYLLTEADS